MELTHRDDEMHWYALQLRPRFEKIVSMHLQGKGYEEYLPVYTSKRRWSDRVKEISSPLFPGYIFCRFNMNHRLPVLVIPGVMSVVSFGGNAIPVSEQELLAVQTVVNSGYPYEPCAYTTVGRRVTIERGPLRGLEGIVVEAKKNYRLIVSVEMLRRSVSVELDWECVTLAPAKETATTVGGFLQGQELRHHKR
jgi:transcription antitermination factor NusG